MDTLDSQSGRAVLNRSQSLIYATGQIASNSKDTLFHYFFLLFFSMAMGLPASWVGAAALFALMIDAITDPLMGSLSDGWRSARWGRRHGFMLAAALPLGIGLFLLFSPPLGLSVFWLTVWMVVFAVWVRVSLTVFYVPFLALNAELTHDYNGRTRLAMLRNLIGNLASIGMFAVFFVFFLKDTPAYPDGQLNVAAYRYIGMTGGGLATLAILLSALGTKRQIPTLAASRSGALSLHRNGFHKVARKAFALRSFRNLTLGYVMLSALSGIATALAIYMFSYFWELSKLEIFGLVLVIGLSVIPGALGAYWLSKTMEKRTVLLGALLGFCVFYTAPIIMRLLGAAPDNHSAVLYIVLCGFLLISQSFAIAITVISQSMMADVSDEYRNVSGHAQEGSLFAVITFAQKVNFGLGTFLAAAGLDIIQFPVQTAVQDIPRRAITLLGVFVVSTVIIMAIITFWFWARYDLSRKRLADIQSVIQ